MLGLGNYDSDEEDEVPVPQAQVRLPTFSPYCTKRV
jgi:hypothetical protein